MLTRQEVETYDMEAVWRCLKERLAIQGSKSSFTMVMSRISTRASLEYPPAFFCPLVFRNKFPGSEGRKEANFKLIVIRSDRLEIDDDWRANISKASS
jgi:hypothetical protein